VTQIVIPAKSARYAGAVLGRFDRLSDPAEGLSDPVSESGSLSLSKGPTQRGRSATEEITRSAGSKQWMLPAQEVISSRRA